MDTPDISMDSLVGPPTNVANRVSIKFDQTTGIFTGVPPQVLEKLKQAGYSLEDVSKNPMLIKDFLYGLDFELTLSPNVDVLGVDSIRLPEKRNRMDMDELGPDGQPKAIEIGPYWVNVGPFQNTNKKVGRTRSNHVIVVNDLTQAGLRIQMNQKLRHLIFINCHNTTIQILDSVVIGTLTCEIVNCTNLIVQWDMVEIHKMRIYDCKNVSIQFSDNETLSEDAIMYWKGCGGKNVVQIIEAIPSNNPNETDMVPFVVTNTQEVPEFDETVIGCTKLELGKTLKTTKLDVDHAEYGRSAKHVIEDISRGLKGMNLPPGLPTFVVPPSSLRSVHPAPQPPSTEY